MTAARAAGRSSRAAAAKLTGWPGRTPQWRCGHRLSRRVPAPTTDDPDRERCSSCGAVFTGSMGEPAPPVDPVQLSP
jgi:hypothetical protein